MRDALSVYRSLVARGAAPALTWYGGDGRIELSGRVAANHLAKICGYLLDEIWLTPGQALHLDLPAHWKQVLWGLGGLLAGATVTCRGDAAPSASGYATEGAGCASGIDARRGSADGDSAGGQAPACVLVTDGPDSRAAQAAQDVLALDLGPLAMAWSGPALPAGVHDAAAEVMGSPDDLADELGFLSSLAPPCAGVYVGGLLAKEVKRSLVELEAGAPTEEDDFVALGYVEELLHQLASFLHRCGELLATVRYFEDRQACACIVEDCGGSVLDHTFVQDGWSGREIVLLHKSSI